MPKETYARCRLCNRHRDEVGLLSHTRLCGECARVELLENVDGLHFKRGWPLERWRRGMAASVGAVLPEDL